MIQVLKHLVQIIQTYLIMNKYLIENNKIIEETTFNDDFVNNFTSTLKINLLQNVYILIENILHTLISNYYHDQFIHLTIFIMYPLK